MPIPARLALESEMPGTPLPANLENAISRELRDQLVNAYTPHKGNCHELARFLQDPGNRRATTTTLFLPLFARRQPSVLAPRVESGRLLQLVALTLPPTRTPHLVVVFSIRLKAAKTFRKPPPKYAGKRQANPLLVPLA